MINKTAATINGRHKNFVFWASVYESPSKLCINKGRIFKFKMGLFSIDNTAIEYEFAWLKKPTRKNRSTYREIIRMIEKFNKQYL